MHTLCLKLIYGLSALVSLWFLMTNYIAGSVNVRITLSVIIFILFLFYFLMRKKELTLIKVLNVGFFNFIMHRVTFVIIIVITIGLLLRLVIFFHFFYDPVSDPATFYNGAQAVASGYGLTDNKYIAFFPFVAAYINLLSFSMKLFGIQWIAVIMLNTLFDFAAAATVYFTLKLFVQSAHAPTFAFTIWFLSPFSIIFSVLSLPIVVVNFFIILTIYLVQLLSKEVSLKSSVRTTSIPIIIFSVLLGLTLGIGNCFRPIFTVAIIALVFCFLLMIFRKNKLVKHIGFRLGLSVIVVLAVFILITNANNALISAQTSLKTPSNPSGWSVYVGSNPDSNGKWNSIDRTYRDELIATNQDMQAVHDQLFKEGLERYEKSGIGGILWLFVKKLYVFSATQHGIFDATKSIIGFKESLLSTAFKIYILIYITSLYFACAKYLYKVATQIHRKTFFDDENTLYTSILLLGLFFSSMLVEVSLRYAQVLYPAFIIFAALSFYEWEKSKLEQITSLTGKRDDILDKG